MPNPASRGRCVRWVSASVRDRVVQQAVKIVLEPIMEADFLPCSYGFRPRRSAHDALQAMRDAVRAGRTWVVDADIDLMSRIDGGGWKRDVATATGTKGTRGKAGENGTPGPTATTRHRAGRLPYTGRSTGRRSTHSCRVSTPTWCVGSATSANGCGRRKGLRMLGRDRQAVPSHVCALGLDSLRSRRLVIRMTRAR